MNYYIYVILCILLTGMGQLLLKLGAKNGKNNVSLYLNPYTMTGYFLLFIVTIFAVLALNVMALKTFYVIMSLNYIVVAIMSKVFLNEAISFNKAVATALIIMGVVVFNL